MDTFRELMLRQPKIAPDDIKPTSLPGLSNPVFEVASQSEDREICQPSVHPGIYCDGVHCQGSTDPEEPIHGNRFTCLDCPNTDFCERCVASPDNDHDTSHALWKIHPPSMCAVCRGMDLPLRGEHDLFFGPYKEYESDVAVFMRIAKAERCGHCAFLWGALAQCPPPDGWPPDGEKVKIRFRRPAKNCFDFAVVLDKNKSTGELGFYVHTIQRVTDQEYSLQVYPVLPWSHEIVEDATGTGSGESDVTLARVNRDSGSQESFQLARYWLQNCRKNHTECGQTATSTLPTRLIDLRVGDQTRVYVRDMAGSSGDYAALSYCWGTGPNGAATTKENIREHQEDGILIEDLPPTARDAVRAALALDIRYLWIDRLCIVQNDEDDWARESSMMCSIYEDALLTISADGSKNVWDGIFREQGYASLDYQKYIEGILIRERHSHSSLGTQISDKSQPLHLRAWTLQERLMSRRVLHFTSNELVWECNRKCECECRRQSGDSFRWLNPNFMSDMERIYDQWRDVVKEYTSRSLTKEFDKLPALSGLVTKFQNIMTQVAGQSDTYLAGLWCGNLAAELAWKPPTEGGRETWLRNNASPTPVIGDNVDPDIRIAMERMTLQDWRRPKGFVAPSWSWASMKGPISYLECYPPAPFKSYIEVTEAKATPRNRLEPNGQVQEASITLRGYVVHNMELTAFQGGFTAKNGEDTVFKEFCFVTYADKYCIEFEPDDPIGSIRRYGGDIRSVVCLLLGTRDCLFKSGAMIQGLSNITNRISRIDKDKSGTGGSSGEGDLVQVARKEAYSDSSKPANNLHDIFRIENDGETEDGEIARWSSYLILAKSRNQPEAYERLGCFDIGMRRVEREMMEDVFQNSTWEKITII